MATYDTAEIRRAARSVARSRDHLHATVVNGLRAIRSEVEDELVGQTADALTERLNNMDSDARKIDEKLDILYRGLMKFAKDLDDADREMASRM